jgi:hypothetical protein
MASTIISPVSGAPGPVVYPNASGANNAALFNDMNIIIPDLIPELYDRYGAENYGMLIEFMGEIGGAMRSVTETGTSSTRQFFHYEKGRAFPSGTVNANVTSATAGLSVTVTLASGSYTNSGTESGFQANAIGFVGSTGVKFQVGTVTRTANAFTVILKPVSTTGSLASLGQASTILAGETLLLVGNQAAGEGSTAMLSTNSLIYKITGSTTEVRDDYPITDVAKMNSTPINFGGGNYSYYKLGQTELNKRFMYSVENAVIEGVDASNLTSTNGSIGTLGIIPQVAANGPTVDYTIGSMAIGDLQALARVNQYAGGPSEYHVLQETNQQDDLDTLLFGKYNNGAIKYASVGGEERASVAYGFKSFNVKGTNYHFWVYRNFSIPTVYGLMPTLGAARANYGLCIAQGVTPDAKSGTLAPNMQWVYQEVTPGMRFHTYESGGLANANKTTTMNIVLTQICYVGTRCKGPQQFAQFQGTY